MMLSAPTSEIKRNFKIFETAFFEESLYAVSTILNSDWNFRRGSLTLNLASQIAVSAWTEEWCRYDFRPSSVMIAHSRRNCLLMRAWRT
jgi:hypothetical protein